MNPDGPPAPPAGAAKPRIPDPVADPAGFAAATSAAAVSAAERATASAMANVPTVTVPATPYPAEAYAAAPYATAAYPPYPLTPVDEPPRERSALGVLTFGAAMVTAGVLVALDRGDVFEVPTVVVLASALAVVGLGLLIGAWFGRSRRLIGLGVALAVVTAFVGIVHLPASNSIGDEQWYPANAGEVADQYSWGVGDIDLDLGAVTSPNTVTTSVELGIGDATIMVPPNAIVNVTADIGMGAIEVENGDGSTQRAEGVNRDETMRSEPSEKAVREADQTPRSTTFDIHITVGLGHVEVVRA